MPINVSAFPVFNINNHIERSANIVQNLMLTNVSNSGRTSNTRLQPAFVPGIGYSTKGGSPERTKLQAEAFDKGVSYLQDKLNINDGKIRDINGSVLGIRFGYMGTIAKAVHEGLEQKEAPTVVEISACEAMDKALNTLGRALDRYKGRGREAGAYGPRHGAERLSKARLKAETKCVEAMQAIGQGEFCSVICKDYVLPATLQRVQQNFGQVPTNGDLTGALEEASVHDAQEMLEGVLATGDFDGAMAAINHLLTIPLFVRNPPAPEENPAPPQNERAPPAFPANMPPGGIYFAPKMDNRSKLDNKTDQTLSDAFVRALDRNAEVMLRMLDTIDKLGEHLIGVRNLGTVTDANDRTLITLRDDKIKTGDEDSEGSDSGVDDDDIDLNLLVRLPRIKTSQPPLGDPDPDYSLDGNEDLEGSDRGVYDDDIDLDLLVRLPRIKTSQPPLGDPDPDYSLDGNEGLGGSDSGVDDDGVDLDLLERFQRLKTLQSPLIDLNDNKIDDDAKSDTSSYRKLRDELLHVSGSLFTSRRDLNQNGNIQRGDNDSVSSSGDSDLPDDSSSPPPPPPPPPPGGGPRVDASSNNQTKESYQGTVVVDSIDMKAAREIFNRRGDEQTDNRGILSVFGTRSTHNYTGLKEEGDSTRNGRVLGTTAGVRKSDPATEARGKPSSPRILHFNGTLASANPPKQGNGFWYREDRVAGETETPNVTPQDQIA
jgi:hypothetical protein